MMDKWQIYVQRGKLSYWLSKGYKVIHPQPNLSEEIIKIYGDVKKDELDRLRKLNYGNDPVLVEKVSKEEF